MSDVESQPIYSFLQQISQKEEIPPCPLQGAEVTKVSWLLKRKNGGQKAIVQYIQRAEH